MVRTLRSAITQQGSIPTWDRRSCSSVGNDRTGGPVSTTLNHPPNHAMQRSSRLGTRIADRRRLATMRRIAILAGLATLTSAHAQELTQTLDLNAYVDSLLPPTPPITDCITDHHRRGRPTEKPIESGEEFKIALELDLKATMGNAADGLFDREPICFYELPDGNILMRDGVGIEYYFRQIPKWVVDRVDLPPRQPTQ